MAEGCRVIAGSARGTRLDARRSAATRPLSDRVKQALFGALEAGGALDGPFLDLFAGTGAAGIEALSRGAPGATFVEHDARTCALIRANLGRTALSGGTIVRADVAAFLAADERVHAPYSACLVDPPYGSPAAEQALALLGGGAGWLAEGAVVVVKHFWRDEPPAAVGSLVRARQRRFGETVLTFYTQRQ